MDETRSTLDLLAEARAALVEPPTDDERSALQKIIYTTPSIIGLTDAILASDVWRNRRQGPITEAQVDAAVRAHYAAGGRGTTREPMRVALEAASKA